MGRRIAPLAILAVAAALRLWRLGIVPPGFQFDEAHNAIDAARIIGGARPLYLADNGGREALLSYAHALMLGGLGLDHPVLALRLTSAFIGLVTVAVVLVVVGRTTGRRDLGRLAAAVLAVLYWHVHFSRYGIRTILAPLWVTLAVGAWWAAIDHGGPTAARRTRLWAAACGTVLAAAAWSHPTGRLMPLILVGHAGYRAVASRGRSVRADVRALALAGATALALFAPLGAHFVRHPDLFTGHPGDVGLAAVAAAHYGGRVGAALLAQAAAVAGMFVVAGDPSTFHNLPGRPVFDPLTSLAVIAGLVCAAAAAWQRRAARGANQGRATTTGNAAAERGIAADGARGRRRELAALALIWLGVGLLPTLLSDRAPNFSRATAALPVVALIAAAALASLAKVVRPMALSRAVVPAVLAVAGAWTVHDYFWTFARDPQVYYSYDVEKLDALRALRDRAADASVFLAPVWATHATIAYLNQDAVAAAERRAGAAFMADVGDPAYAGRIIDASGEASGEAWSEERGDAATGEAAPPRIGQLDARQTLVYPDDGRDVIVAMPAREADKTDWDGDILRFLGVAPSTAETVRDAQDRALLALRRIPAAAFGDAAPPTDAPLEPAVWTHVRFGGAVELMGYTVGPAKPGEMLPVRLWWRAQEPLDRNWTVFVHLLGPGDANWGQDDREPGQASYRTTDWQGGEVIIDAYRPTLAPAAAGEVRWCIGWYDSATGERLKTNDGQDAFCPRPITVQGR